MNSAADKHFVNGACQIASKVQKYFEMLNFYKKLTRGKGKQKEKEQTCKVDIYTCRCIYYM